MHRYESVTPDGANMFNCSLTSQDWQLLMVYKAADWTQQNCVENLTVIFIILHHYVENKDLIFNDVILLEMHVFEQ